MLTVFCWPTGEGSLVAAASSARSRGLLSARIATRYYLLLAAPRVACFATVPRWPRNPSAGAAHDDLPQPVLDSGDCRGRRARCLPSVAKARWPQVGLRPLGPCRGGVQHLEWQGGRRRPAARHAGAGHRTPPCTVNSATVTLWSCPATRRREQQGQVGDRPHFRRAGSFRPSGMATERCCG